MKPSAGGGLWRYVPEQVTRILTGETGSTQTDRAQHVRPTSHGDTIEFARIASSAAVVFAVALPLVELGRVGLYDDVAGHTAAAVVATALTLPLHLRHVLYGVRGLRPPGGPWTLAILAVVNVVAALVIGAGWLMNFASLAVSVLIVVPWPWAFVPFAAVVLGTWPLAALYPYGPAPFLGLSAYLTISVLWRSVTQFVLVWLVAGTRQLQAARNELRDRAVVRERMRIEQELRQGIGTALRQIGVRARSARSHAFTETTAAAADLRAVIDDARGTLTVARGLVAGYQRGSIRAELDAGMSLLEAAGVNARLVIAEDADLNTANEDTRAAARAAFVEALRDDRLADSLIMVSRGARGELRIHVASEALAKRTGRQ